MLVSNKFYLITNISHADNKISPTKQQRSMRELTVLWFSIIDDVAGNHNQYHHPTYVPIPLTIRAQLLRLSMQNMLCWFRYVKLCAE